MKTIIDNIQALLERFHPPTPPLQVVTLPNTLQGGAVVQDGYRLVTFNGPQETLPRHTFTDLDRFVGWLHREAAEGRMLPSEVDIMISEEEIIACASSYRHLSATVSCSLAADPTWEAWEGLLGEWVSPKALFDHVRRVADSFPVVSREVRDRMVEGGRRTIEQQSADPLLAALQDLKITGLQAFEVRRSPTGAILAQASSADTTINAELPERMQIITPVYGAAPSLKVEVELLLSTRVLRTDQGLALYLRLEAPRWPQAKREARAQLGNELDSQLGTGWLVSIGEHRTTVAQAPIESR